MTTTNVLLIDHDRDRRCAIGDVFVHSGYSTQHCNEIPDAPKNLTDFRLLILHQKSQENRGGNDGSRYYFSEILAPLVREGKLAVIGYTGGNADDHREPSEYAGLAYCRFLNNVTDANSADFIGFAKAWLASPQGPPPFGLLRPEVPKLHHTLAAYLLRSAGLLESDSTTRDIKKKADAESNGDFCAAIDNFFGFGSPRILHLTEPGIRVLSLRAKVSHSLIDHEVLLISEDVAVARLPAHWVEIEARWATLYELAQDFGKVIPEISASALVDDLKALTVLSAQTREELKLRLDALNGKTNGQSLYSDRLDIFWKAAEKFFGQVKQGACADEIRDGWRTVRKSADDMKALFRDGTIPDGIPLP